MMFISMNVIQITNLTSLSIKSRNKKEEMEGSTSYSFDGISALSQEVSLRFPIHTGKP